LLFIDKGEQGFMKIVFHDHFNQTDYAQDAASVPGRLEAIMTAFRDQAGFETVCPAQAREEDILLAHTPGYIQAVKANSKRTHMAMLSAGAAILCAEIGMTGVPAFACLRPPGHHASPDSAWGYCVFCNMGIALLKLKANKRINSAFVLDFDAHTGDGTKAVLSAWKDCRILNPSADTGKLYVQQIETLTRDIPEVDIVGVSAGFDLYEKDLGKKLTSFDFYLIGDQMKRFAMRAAGGRRFAILEGGYYLPDLGKNVLAFCQGFQ
jgi:acetoin utilization deacetylase AcuC-like enzyme